MWNQRFKTFLKSQQLSVSEFDECIFFGRSPFLIISIYEDDGTILSEDQQTADNILSQFEKEFEVHLVNSQVFLGFQYKIDNDYHPSAKLH